MEVIDDCFFFTERKSNNKASYHSAEDIVVLATKLHAVQRHRESQHPDGSGQTKCFTPDSDPVDSERKIVTPLPIFTSTWNPDEQLQKYIFDKLRWDAQKLLLELAKFLYCYQWTTSNGGCAVKFHSRMVEFLQLEYKELTSGCPLVYYRWQSQKYQEKYLAKLKANNNNEREAAASVAASGTIRLGASNNGGSSSTLIFGQQTFRSRLGSAASATGRSELSQTTSTSHGPENQTARQKKPDRKDENHSKFNGHIVPRVQFLWSTTARQRERDNAQLCEQPIMTMQSNPLISAEALPIKKITNKSNSEQTDSHRLPLPGDVTKSIAFLKRALELFGEMARKREAEDKRWLETGRIYACRVSCHGDRRSALMSRSKSAALHQSASLPTSSTPLAPEPPKSAKVPRPVTSKHPDLSQVPRAPVPAAFSVLSSFNTGLQQQIFHYHDALQGKVPKFIAEAAPYRRKIFLAALPDGSYSTYYANGKPAVIQFCHLSKSFPVPSLMTTLAYDRSAVGNIILMATPTSLYAYAPKYDKRLFADLKSLTIITAEIHVETHPNWQSKRLSSALHFELSDDLHLTINSPERITLTFQNHATTESFKFALGFSANFKIPAPEVKYLQTTDIEFQSKTASELAKPSKVKTSQQRSSFGQNQNRPLTKSEQIAKKLGFIDSNYANDLTAHLKRLRNKVGWICESWLSHYCLWLGVTEIRGLTTETPAARLFNKRSATRMAHSAGAGHSVSDDESNFKTISSEEGSKKKKRAQSSESRQADSSVPSMSLPTPVEPVTPVYEKHLRTPSIAVEQGKLLSRNNSISETGKLAQIERLKASQRPLSPATASTSPVPPAPPVSLIDQALMKAPQSNSLTEIQLIGVCPVSLRRHMTEGLDASAPQLRFCHCSRQKAPLVTDVELDLFLTKFSPQNQMIIVQIVNAHESHISNKCGVIPSPVNKLEEVIDDMYNKVSIYRPRPCVDSISDRFRFIRYDLSSASNSVVSNPASSDSRRVPLLIRRHNVRRGMTLMYHNGNLVSCVVISPPTCETLLRHIDQTWRLAVRSFTLPSDYRINSLVTTMDSNEARASRQADVFVTKFTGRAKSGKDNQLNLEICNEETVLTNTFLGRDGPHPTREFPCLHMPAA